MAIIFIQSSFPSIELPKLDLISFDKLIHSGVYGLLALLCSVSLIHQSKVKSFYESPFAWAFVFTIIYGASDEYHQTFVHNRSGEIPDWIADVIGAFVMVLVIKFFLSRRFNFLNRKILPN